MYERILVPIDGSKGTTHVAMQAFDIAKQYGATVHVLHVVERDAETERSGPNDSWDELAPRPRQAAETIQELADSHGIDPVLELRAGEPAEGILAYADEIDADLIVMGTHGRSRIERQLIGSVAEAVVRRSEHPVLTIRLPGPNRTVTEESHAADLAAVSLRSAGYTEATVDGATQQRNLWIVEATADDDPYTVYVDPVTQQTSPVRRRRT